MTGPEHYRMAEKLLASADDNFLRDGDAGSALPAAQVHATLALAAATALNDGDGGAPIVDYPAWKAVASVENT